MRHTDRVHEDLDLWLVTDNDTGSPGVIEVNVRNEDLRQPRRIEAGGHDSGPQVRQC